MKLAVGIGEGWTSASIFLCVGEWRATAAHGVAQVGLDRGQRALPAGAATACDAESAAVEVEVLLHEIGG